MKNLDLNKYGVQEMNAKEINKVEGGNIFADAWNWLVNHGKDDKIVISI